MTSTHVVALEFAGSGLAKPFGCTLFCFHFRHNYTAHFLNTFTRETDRIAQKRSVYRGASCPSLVFFLLNPSRLKGRKSCGLI